MLSNAMILINAQEIFVIFRVSHYLIALFLIMQQALIVAAYANHAMVLALV
jgi:hypothetical protein